MASTETEQSPKKRTGAVKKAPNDNKKEAQPNPLVRYFRETRGEMRKVTWPTREEAWRLTGVVLAFTAAFALFLGSLDFVWSTAFQTLIQFLVG